MASRQFCAEVLLAFPFQSEPPWLLHKTDQNLAQIAAALRVVPFSGPEEPLPRRVVKFMSVVGVEDEEVESSKQRLRRREARS